MDKVYDKCCGIDVHKKLIVACFRQGNKQEIREFGATTRELLELADWLKEGNCEMVAMLCAVVSASLTSNLDLIRLAL